MNINSVALKLGLLGNKTYILSENALIGLFGTQSQIKAYKIQDSELDITEYYDIVPRNIGDNTKYLAFILDSNLDEFIVVNRNLEEISRYKMREVIDIVDNYFVVAKEISNLSYEIFTVAGNPLYNGLLVRKPEIYRFSGDSVVIVEYLVLGWVEVFIATKGIEDNRENPPIKQPLIKYQQYSIYQVYYCKNAYVIRYIDVDDEVRDIHVVKVYDYNNKLRLLIKDGVLNVNTDENGKTTHIDVLDKYMKHLKTYEVLERIY